MAIFTVVHGWIVCCILYIACTIFEYERVVLWEIDIPYWTTEKLTERLSSERKMSKACSVS